MSFAEKYNKFNTIFDIDIKDFEFMDGYDFIAKYGDNVVKIDGLYINKKETTTTIQLQSSSPRRFF